MLKLAQVLAGASHAIPSTSHHTAIQGHSRPRALACPACHLEGQAGPGLRLSRARPCHPLPKRVCSPGPMTPHPASNGGGAVRDGSSFQTLSPRSRTNGWHWRWRKEGPGRGAGLCEPRSRPGRLQSGGRGACRSEHGMGTQLGQLSVVGEEGPCHSGAQDGAVQGARNVVGG